MSFVIPIFLHLPSLYCLFFLSSHFWLRDMWFIHPYDAAFVSANHVWIFLTNFSFLPCPMSPTYQTDQQIQIPHTMCTYHLNLSAYITSRVFSPLTQSHNVSFEGKA
jgi:hypothetical protein